MTIGVDCFNPQECMAITQDMAMRGEQAAQHDAERAHETQVRDEHIAELLAERDALRGEVEAKRKLLAYVRRTLDEPSLDKPCSLKDHILLDNKRECYQTIDELCADIDEAIASPDQASGGGGQ